MKVLIKSTAQGLEIEIPDSEIKAILRDVWPRAESKPAAKEVQSAVGKNDKEILTAQEAAQLLNVKEGTLYIWALQRRIPSIKVGRLRRFVKSEIMEWFEKK